MRYVVSFVFHSGKTLEHKDVTKIEIYNGWVTLFFANNTYLSVPINVSDRIVSIRNQREVE